MKLENLQKDFTNRIKDLGNMNYWDRLDKLKLLSVSRRFERYKIIYTRKILNGDVPNCGLSWDHNENKGIKFKINYSPNRASDSVKSIRINSFQVQGPTLFNTLPRQLRDSDVSAENWKSELDKYLEQIPDKPFVTGMDSDLCDRYSTQPTNSILEWNAFLVRHKNT